MAAPFTHDACWYRARIAALPTDDTALPPTAQVEFVDFGDRASVHVDQLKKLRPDFLTLRFQAIQCRLAGVEPIGYLNPPLHSPRYPLDFLCLRLDCVQRYFLNVSRRF